MTESAEGRFNSAKLLVWLSAYIDGFRGPFEIAKFPGGQSNPTYRIDAASGSYVLRRKPYGAVLQSAHAVDREFELLSALHPLGFPTPRPLGLCSDPSIAGAMFYVMEMVEGRTFWDGALPGVGPSDRSAIYDALVDTLARLHAIDFNAAGLSAYGRPGNYMERQLKRWVRQYRASQTEHVAAMEKLIAWLPEGVPQQARTAIVHGDFRIDNIIFATTDTRVRAVLDWELSTLGDPLADFSYFALNWVLPTDGGPGLANLDLDDAGIPSLDKITERYCAATAEPRPQSLDWYFAFNLFRLAGILQGIKKRVVDGVASSAEASQKAARVEEFAEAGWRFAVRSGAT